MWYVSVRERRIIIQNGRQNEVAVITYVSVLTANLVNVADFVLKNNYFEFDSCIKQQISGTAIGTKFAPPYACIFVVRWKVHFLSLRIKNHWYG